MEDPSKPANMSYSYSYVATWQYLYNSQSFTCLHVSPFVQKSILFNDICVMNMIHTCDSNIFPQRKRGGYYNNYWNCAILDLYVKLFLMFPGINLLLLLCISTYSWFK